MTISNLTTRQLFNGNGSTTIFAVSVDIQDNSELEVWLRDESDSDNITETLQTLTTHYTLSGDPATTVTFVTAPTSNDKVLLLRNTAKTQATDFLDGGSFSAESVEDALDKLTQETQELREELKRVPKFLKSTPTANEDLELAEPSANKVLAWNAAADKIDLVAEVPTGLAEINDITDGTTTLNPASITDGALATPGMRFASDPNTGIYRPGTDSLGITAGGKEIASFKVNGSGEDEVDIDQAVLLLRERATPATPDATFYKMYVTTDGFVNVVASDGNEKKLLYTRHTLFRYRTANGHGSTDTKIRRFSTSITSAGDGDVATYADTAANGATITLDTDAFVFVSYSDSFTASSAIAISLNSANLTSRVVDHTAAQSATLLGRTSIPNANQAGFCSWSGRADSGDIFRFHTNADSDSAQAWTTGFTFLALEL